MRAAGLWVLVVAAALGGSSCGSDSEALERPLEQAEAATLAQALNANYSRKGARFEVSTLSLPGGPGLFLSGETNWESHEGAALVRLADGSAQVSEVYWRIDAVGERRPALDALLAEVGAPPDPVLHRPVDTSRRLDQVISIIVALASRQPENAQLILQTPGSAFLREDSLRGREASVMRYGTRSIYWLDAATGEMLRLEAYNEAGTMPLVVDIMELGPSEVQYPPSDRLVDWNAVVGLVGGLPSL